MGKVPAGFLDMKCQTCFSNIAECEYTGVAGWLSSAIGKLKLIVKLCKLLAFDSDSLM